MKLRLAHMAVLLVVCIFLFFPVSTANVREWSYKNYLYSLEILSYEDAVTAGQSGSLTLEVGANTDAVLHLELKARFPGVTGSSIRRIYQFQPVHQPYPTR